MMTLAWANVRTYARRYIAVVLAVMIGTAFLAATLMVGASAKASLGASIGASYQHADLIGSVNPEATTDDGSFTPFTSQVLDAVSAAEVDGQPAVLETYGDFAAPAHLTVGGKTISAHVHAVPNTPDFRSVTLENGAFPATASELTVDAATAEKLGLHVGDAVVLETPTGDGAQASAAQMLTLTGITRPSANPAMGATAEAVVSNERLSTMVDTTLGTGTFQIKLAEDVEPTAAVEAVTQALTDAGVGNAQVLTAEEQTVKDVASLSGDTDQLTPVLMVFALVALVVTGLVVTNTFNVLVAQRTRELALLRTLGAARAQIRGAVVLESLILGLVAATLGVALAVGLMTGLVAYVATLPETSFAVLAVPASAVLIALAVGTLMTVLAAWVPARAATRVAPLAALRPADAATAGNRAGRVRLAFGCVAVLAGAAALAYGASTVNLLVSFGGGFVSFIGILMIGSLFLPPAVAGVGKLLATTGVPAKLAALNSVRNPGRTTATATALLIGVTLVSMILVGAQSAKATFDAGLAEEFPVDITVTYDGASRAYSPDAAQDLARVDGVEAALALEHVATASLGTHDEFVYTASTADFTAVLNDPTLIPEPGEIVIPDTHIDEAALKTVTVNGDELTVRATDKGLFAPLVSAETAAGWPPVTQEAETADGQQSFTANTLWAKAVPGLDLAASQDLRSEISQVLGVAEYSVSGGLLEKLMYTSVIDMLLMVVTGLLAVAVLIALIGVANTLSLSILERTRENSLLRALGLTTRQLRGMLALEAVLIAGVAALIGLGLGIGYGLLGTQSALGFLTGMVPAIPWLQLGAVLAVATLAGLLASVIPARRAARLSPVAGLATE